MRPELNQSHSLRLSVQKDAGYISQAKKQALTLMRILDRRKKQQSPTLHCMKGKRHIGNIDLSNRLSAAYASTFYFLTHKQFLFDVATARKTSVLYVYFNHKTAFGAISSLFHEIGHGLNTKQELMFEQHLPEKADLYNEKYARVTGWHAQKELYNALGRPMIELGNPEEYTAYANLNILTQVGSNHVGQTTDVLEFQLTTDELTEQFSPIIPVVHSSAAPTLSISPL